MHIRTLHASPARFGLAVAIALALVGGAIAQDAPTAAQQQELDAARAALDQAAKRYAELARTHGLADRAIQIERHAVRRPVIGVLLAPDDAGGVRIAGVTPDSAAAQGGLKSGDRLVSIGGRRIDAGSGQARLEQARTLLSALDTRTPVRVDYERAGKPLSASLTPKVADRLLVMPGLDGSALDAGDIAVIEVQAREAAGAARDAERGARRVLVEAREAQARARNASRGADWAAAVAPDVRREIIRLGSDCTGNDCRLPALAEALRWNGLNLAAVDARLGRYFGASDGVLVLSTGPELAGLQPGDVIRSIGGKPVRTPREAMAALRAQPVDGSVSVQYLRDRATGTAQVNVPKAISVRVPVPPAPPAPPAPPNAPRPPAAPDAPQVRREVRVVSVDKDGKARSWQGGRGEAPPAWVGTLPRDGATVERRRYVMVDKDGKTLTWEGGPGDTPPAWVKELPVPPAPPAPPAPPTPPAPPAPLPPAGG